MNDSGLSEVVNPSELFLSEMDQSVSGNAVTCVMEGSRPLLVEIQALVTPSNYGTPQRTASGFDQRRLSLLLAVLEKRAGMQFSGQDVYLNIAGGLKVVDTAADLSVICALASSYKDQPVRKNTFVVGEVGLGGEVRMIPNVEQRLKEGAKMGFTNCLTPVKSSSINTELKLISTGYIGQAITQILRHAP
jgi:DNA repair protein RadA/Sms